MTLSQEVCTKEIVALLQHYAGGRASQFENENCIRLLSTSKLNAAKFLENLFCEALAKKFYNRTFSKKPGAIEMEKNWLCAIVGEAYQQIDFEVIANKPQIQELVQQVIQKMFEIIEEQNSQRQQALKLG